MEEKNKKDNNYDGTGLKPLNILLDITGTRNIKEFIMLMAFSIGLVLIFNHFYVFSVVSGPSMFPTLKDRQVVLVDKTVYNREEIKPNDIIVFYSKEANKRVFVKRVIGIEGDKIDISNSEVLVNGEKLQEDYLFEQIFLTEHQEFIDVDVLENEIYVMGDNRNNSNDSRDFGVISKDEIIGKVIFSITPPSKIAD